MRLTIPATIGCRLIMLWHGLATLAKDTSSLLHMLSDRVVLSQIQFWDAIVRRIGYNANRRAHLP